MRTVKINKDNYDKFIFKGSLALETYYDIEKNNDQLIKDFYLKLNNYRELNKKTNEDKENIVNDLISVMETIGIDYFTIYDDGDINYNDKRGNEGNEFK